MTTILPWLRALRIHQWTKNLLIFLPVFFAHKWGDSSAVTGSLLAFAVFCAAASSVYVINDVLDYEADVAHPKKRHRPIAAGLISRRAATAAGVSLAVAAVAAAWTVSVDLCALVFLYLVVAQAYSLWMKSLLLVDVMMLAGFYTLRIFAGSSAADVPISEWFLLFSLFFFLGLAFQKRTAEVRRWSKSGAATTRRSYRVTDLEALRTAGTLCSYLAVLVFALYLQSQQVTIHYARPGVLWWIVPMLLYWTSRIWLLDSRDEVSDDFISFTITDPATYIIGLLTVGTLFLAHPL
jgi:4-hydroxybenzoate polyprenyltransferase